LASTTSLPDAANAAGAPAAADAAAQPAAAGVGDGRSLVFRVAGRAYACDVSAVREVVPLTRFTRLPGAPRQILGLVNVRGSIVTIVDAAAVLHPGEVARPLGMVLVVDAGTRGVGLAVERVADVRALRAAEGYTELDVRDIVTRAVAISEDE
jgi:purine-binding chemotaxis protein CheW